MNQTYTGQAMRQAEANRFAANGIPVHGSDFTVTGNTFNGTSQYGIEIGDSSYFNAQDIRYDSNGDKVRFDVKYGYVNIRDIPSPFCPPEPTIQDQIKEWEAKLTEAAQHPPSKHRDAAMGACYEVLALLENRV